MNSASQPVAECRHFTWSNGSGWRINLRTLVFVRWIAIAGQLITVLSTYFLLGFPLPVEAALGVIGASVFLNVAATLQRGRGMRLGDREAAVYLAYDLIQLGFLLYLTGGLQNPFAILILAPLTIAATVLSRQSVIALTSLALVVISVLAVYHHPLPWPGEGLTLPPTYNAGAWVALSLSSLFIAGYTWSVSQEARQISDALSASQLALAREQQMSALGALAAAAAHELGSPLATITLASRELSRDIPSDSPYAEDIHLIQGQAERCRQILAELSRHPQAEQRGPFDRLPIRALVDTVAMPYRRSGVELDVTVRGDSTSEPPLLPRSPEIVHGLGNILQNALQFARHRVEVEGEWTESRVSLTIRDDGPGFSPQVLNRLGEPYLSSRRGDGEHLGLGIFIAQTLLEQTGARLTFENGRDGGAKVAIHWQRYSLEG